MLGTSDYVERAMSEAEYAELEDGSVFGRIQTCKGVVAFADTLSDGETVLNPTLRWRMRDGSTGSWAETISATITG